MVVRVKCEGEWNSIIILLLRRFITSLYTVIPNGEGLLALKHFFDLRTVKEPSSETLLRLAELVLTLLLPERNSTNL